MVFDFAIITIYFLKWITGLYWVEGLIVKYGWHGNRAVLKIVGPGPPQVKVNKDEPKFLWAGFTGRVTFFLSGRPENNIYPSAFMTSHPPNHRRYSTYRTANCWSHRNFTEKKKWVRLYVSRWLKASLVNKEGSKTQP
jgi:hypothetical protein